MRRRLAGRASVVIGGLAMLLLVAALMTLMPMAWRESARESSFDLVLAADAVFRKAPHASKPVMVVDIDRASIEALGAWPWPRETMAELVQAVMARKPAALALDILFAEPDTHSPAELARRLGLRTGRIDIIKLAETLPDGDKRLAEAIAGAPIALGFALDPEQERPIKTVPVLVRGAPVLDQIWRATGAVGPVRVLSDAASGLGVMALPGDADGAVRRVPLLAVVGRTIVPGLAAEAVRLASGASTYLVQEGPPLMSIGDTRVALSSDAHLRLTPTNVAHHSGRTISAVDLVQRRNDGSRLTDALVLLGTSAPELGGLRQTATEPLTPSVQIQADAVAQLLAGRSPLALETSLAAEVATATAAGLVATALAVLPPVLGVGALCALVAAGWAAAIGTSVVTDRLVDPAAPTVTALLVFFAASITAYAQARRREARIQRRFAQHLAPAVVQRIIAEPGLVKLHGERREITALFTDIEGFTAMTHRAGPEQLIAGLDAYFEGVTASVIRHGGMVDKIVGDAVHALFNAPIDLAGHPGTALDCALEIRTWTESFRQGPIATALAMGRTRIGIETGNAVVGDVGLQSKLDYTAHGDAVNMAARLEAANKLLGSTICVGPTAAECCGLERFRPLGKVAIRGRDETVEAFEPWPDDYAAADRDEYMQAIRLSPQDPGRAADLFRQIAAKHPDDPLPRLAVERLRQNRTA